MTKTPPTAASVVKREATKKVKREAKTVLKAQRLENLRLARVAKGIGKK